MRRHRQQQPALGGAPVTAGLLGMNTVIFLLQGLWGGSESTRTLLKMGAIVSGAPPALFWPSLLTYGYLHIGPIHLGMNMLGLWNIGRSLEPLLGQSRFFLLYTLSLIGGGVAIARLSPGPHVTAGASGALFGLLGAICALLIGRHRQSDSDAERRGIRSTLVRMLLPNLLISLLPGVSFMGHAGGLLVGALLMAGVLLPTAARARPARGARQSRLVAGAALLLGVLTMAALAWVWTVHAPWR